MADAPSDDFIRGLVYAEKLARRAQHDYEEHGSVEQSVGASQVAGQIEKAIKNKKKAQEDTLANLKGPLLADVEGRPVSKHLMGPEGLYQAITRICGKGIVYYGTEHDPCIGVEVPESTVSDLEQWAEENAPATVAVLVGPLEDEEVADGEIIMRDRNLYFPSLKREKNSGKPID